MENHDDDQSFVILQSDEEIQALHTMPVPDRRNIHDVLPNLHEENNRLKAQITSMMTQFEALSEWQEEVLHAHQSHKLKFEETRGLVMKLRCENAVLKSKLDSEVNNSKQSTTIQNDALVASQLNQHHGDKRDLFMERDLLKEECTRLTLQNSHLEDVIKSKSEEISLLRGNFTGLAFMADDAVDPGKGSICKVKGGEGAELELIKLELCEEKTAADVTKKSLCELQANYNYLSGEFEKLKESYANELRRKTEEVEKIKDELLKTREELNKANAALSGEMTKCNNLKEEVLNVKLQIETFKSDFEEERQARENLAGEKAALEQQIREMKQEMLTIRPPPTNPDVSSIVMGPLKFECPVCTRRFSELSLCSSHVNECLDSPPAVVRGPVKRKQF